MKCGNKNCENHRKGDCGIKMKDWCSGYTPEGCLKVMEDELD